jgi:CheY-like chemotaxis protein
VSYGIARAHGGALSYASMSEGGAEFTLALPHAAPAQASGAAARRILVADGDAAVHRLVSALVAPAGHAVDVARLGGEAVQLSNQHEYHLVIADSTLVVENGIAVLDGVLASRPDWRPRLVSVGQRIGGCPASIHLDKPLDVKLLRAAIDEVLSTPPPSPASTARP